MLQVLCFTILPLIMMAAAVGDVAGMRIPNWLTGLLAALFFPMAFLTGMPFAEFGWHVAGGVILFVAGFLLFQFRLFGGGDAKLMAAAGLWFGTAQTLPFIIMTVFFGGILAIGFMLWSTLIYWLDMHGAGSDKENHWLKQMMRVKVPYGLAIAAGAIAAFPDTWWMNVA
jgi:prepilin peptidase CpaA